MPADRPKVGELSRRELRRRLEEQGLGVRIGPFDVCLQVAVPSILDSLHALYRSYPVLELDRTFSFHVRLEEQRRAFRRGMVRFVVDGKAPHEDMPLAHALAVLEWGINLVIAFRHHSFLMLHAGVVEKAGRAVVLPAEPGSGKTTLSAALMLSGWRLLSDEFGLLPPGTLGFVPVPRPMPLKNESISVIKSFGRGGFLGPEIPNTRKGTIAHLRPSESSIQFAGRVARAGAVVFPKWESGAALELEELPQSEAFSALASNSFNYELLGETGFRAVVTLVSSVKSYRLRYSDLEGAIDAVDGVLRQDAVDCD